MSTKQTNKLLIITNTSKSLNTRRVTRQQSAQTEASVSHYIPLGSVHITTTVSKYTVSYSLCLKYYTIFITLKILLNIYLLR